MSAVSLQEEDGKQIFRWSPGEQVRVLQAELQLPWISLVRQTFSPSASGLFPECIRPFPQVHQTSQGQQILRCMLCSDRGIEPMHCTQACMHPCLCAQGRVLLLEHACLQAAVQVASGPEAPRSAELRLRTYGAHNVWRVWTYTGYACSSSFSPPPSHPLLASQVTAVAHDNPIPGFNTRNCINLRLWAAKPSREFDLEAFNTGVRMACVFVRERGREGEREGEGDTESQQGQCRYASAPLCVLMYTCVSSEGGECMSRGRHRDCRCVLGFMCACARVHARA